MAAPVRNKPAAPKVASKAASTSEKENTSTRPPAGGSRSRSGSATAPVPDSSETAEQLVLANKEISHLKTEVDRLQSSQAELRVEMGGIEKEREFYFDKLREIEMMLQDLEDNGNGNELTASIFEILYATADGFQPVDDEPAGEADVEQEGTMAGDVVDGDIADETATMDQPAIEELETF